MVLAAEGCGVFGGLMGCNPAGVSAKMWKCDVGGGPISVGRESMSTCSDKFTALFTRKGILLVGYSIRISSYVILVGRAIDQQDHVVSTQSRPCRQMRLLKILCLVLFVCSCFIHNL
jgi:hypothetical protein